MLERPSGPSFIALFLMLQTSLLLAGSGSQPHDLCWIILVFSPSLMSQLSSWVRACSRSDRILDHLLWRYGTFVIAYAISFRLSAQLFNPSLHFFKASEKKKKIYLVILVIRQGTQQTKRCSDTSHCFSDPAHNYN